MHRFRVSVYTSRSNSRPAQDFASPPTLLRAKECDRTLVGRKHGQLRINNPQSIVPSGANYSEGGSRSNPLYIPQDTRLRQLSDGGTNSVQIAIAA